MADNEIDSHSGVETTGHEWDEIKELNNPLPRWWLIVFYATVVWSIAYWIAMPAWPGISGYTKGLREHSERENVVAAVAALDEEREAQMTRLIKASSISEIESDPELLQFSMAAGKSLFGDNCATCHGAGGQGFPGYPSLVDDAWLWGGTLDDIQQTIHYGIRSGHSDTRFNIMQAYGRDGLLNRDQVDDLASYVVSLSGRDADPEAIERAAPLFAQQCTTCHGADGTGDTAQGAPDLTDAIWLYGGDAVTIRQSIHNGRGGVMPYWTERLSETQITALAVYVHALGGGE